MKIYPIESNAVTCSQAKFLRRRFGEVLCLMQTAANPLINNMNNIKNDEKPQNSTDRERSSREMV